VNEKALRIAMYVVSGVRSLEGGFHEDELELLGISRESVEVDGYTDESVRLAGAEYLISAIANDGGNERLEADLKALQDARE
jgi:hypothetical protein